MIRFAGLCRSRLHLVWTMVHARLYSARLFLEYCSTVGVRETDRRQSRAFHPGAGIEANTVPAATTRDADVVAASPAGR